jgi:hypothetical protein
LSRPCEGIPTSSFSSNPADIARIKAAAHAAWELVKGFEERARQQKEGLAAILAQVGQGARQTLDQIVDLFTPVTEIFVEFCEGFAKLQQKLSALLKGRPGATEAHPVRRRQAQGIDDRCEGVARMAPDPVWIDPKQKEEFPEALRSAGGAAAGPQVTRVAPAQTNPVARRRSWCDCDGELKVVRCQWSAISRQRSAVSKQKTAADC